MSNPFRKLANFTSEVCNKCPVPEEDKESHERIRCCHRMFCDMVLHRLPEDSYYRALYDPSQEVPFLKDSKCQVKPEHRPFCTGYICHWNVGPEGSLSKENQKTYRKLCKKAGLLPITEKVGDRAREMMEKLNRPPEDSLMEIPEAIRTLGED